ncbi:MAG: LysR substrate-binding domain-containing protein [Marinobacterium sp.]|nr:LysR substrate-binding domain-containing protein [Marinobacterium sp.]
MHNLSIRHLRAFVTVAECGSFTRAAAQLHLTQSTLTATIKQLEEQAGLTLLDRTTRRVFLSGEGERFLPIARGLLSNFDTALSDLQAVAAGQSGQIGIAASPSVLSQLLPAVVARFHQQYPAVGIHLRDDSAGGIEQRVLSNEMDFGIGGNHSHHIELDYQPILRDRYGVILPDNHGLLDTSVMHWAQLTEQQLIYLTSDTGIRAQLSRMSAQMPGGLALDGPLIEVSNPAGLAELVREGIGIAVLPALAATTASVASLNFRPLAEPVIEREINIITRKGRSLSPVAARLMDNLIQYIAQRNWPGHVSAIKP